MPTAALILQLLEALEPIAILDLTGSSTAPSLAGDTGPVPLDVSPTAPALIGSP